MSSQIQPSNDPRSTAIAVAWDMVRVYNIEGETEKKTKKQAELVAELSAIILAGTGTTEMLKRAAAGKKS